MAEIREKPLTKRGRETPCVRQVSVFVENRVGALASLMGIFDNSNVKTLALTVMQGFDCAIVRFVFSDTDMAVRILTQCDYRYTVCELVAVEMPGGSSVDGLGKIGKALLSAEIDIHYLYGLITNPNRSAAVVIHVDNPALASMVLAEKNFALLDENDLR
ncbi:MAG TPA: acetolactate synthase [Phycisphaerae bacterium]|nr:acetolactate synthase [Phycisphaerae bacterium]